MKFLKILNKRVNNQGTLASSCTIKSFRTRNVVLKNVTALFRPSDWSAGEYSLVVFGDAHVRERTSGESGAMKYCFATGVSAIIVTELNSMDEDACRSPGPMFHVGLLLGGYMGEGVSP